MKTFVDRLVDEMRRKKSILCLGLDPQVRYIPTHILRQGWEEAKNKNNFEPTARAFVIFNKSIIKAVAPYVPVVKPNRAFYGAYKSWGIWALEETLKIAREQGLIVIIDAKPGDGGDTAMIDAKGYIGEVDVWTPEEDGKIIQVPSYGFDAVTVVPYIGDSAVSPFMEEVNKSIRASVEATIDSGRGVFIVDKTSFKPDSRLEQLDTVSGLKVWQRVAEFVKEWGKGTEGANGYWNVGVVLGATKPTDASFMRKTLHNSFCLVPGYSLPEGLGQGGSADEAVAGVDENGLGVIPNISRGGSYAYLKGMFKGEPEDYLDCTVKAVKFSVNDLNAALERAGKIPW